MKQLAVTVILILLFTSLRAEESNGSRPIADGEYWFTHRYAEHPNMESIRLKVVIRGRHISLTNSDKFDVFPKGVIDEGILLWHAKSKQWIVSHTPDDENAEEVGGCTGGPAVIDLKKRIYWTC